MNKPWRNNMPSKTSSKAFIALMVVSLISLLVSIAAPVEYFYDELNRLKEVRYPDGTKIFYHYDKKSALSHPSERALFFWRFPRRFATLPPMTIKPASRNPWSFLPTLYFAEGLPYVLINTVSVMAAAGLICMIYHRVRPIHASVSSLISRPGPRLRCWPMTKA
jgi:hypothetical protein